MINTKMSPKAYAEVYDIIQNSSKEIQKKIPNSFINLLKENMDPDAVIKIDYSKSLENQNLERETIVLLGIIYRDFLCGIETKNILIVKEKKELAEAEILKREKYDPDNMFKKKKTIVEPQANKEETSLIEYKPKRWYKKIWFKIKSIFGA